MIHSSDFANAKYRRLTHRIFLHSFSYNEITKKKVLKKRYEMHISTPQPVPPSLHKQHTTRPRARSTLRNTEFAPNWAFLLRIVIRAGGGVVMVGGWGGRG